MGIVTFLAIKRWNQHKSVQQSHQNSDHSNLPGIRAL